MIPVQRPDPAAAGGAPPDPFGGGGVLGALAVGFAAGFGGPSVQQMQEQARQRSWSAYMQTQEMKLRREELAQREGQFRASLDLQERDLEYRQGAEQRKYDQDVRLAKINEGGATARALLSEAGQTFRQNREFASKRDERAAVRAESAADAAGAAAVAGLPAPPPGTTLQGLGIGSDIKARNAAATEDRRKSDEATGLRIWETIRRERSDDRQAKAQLDANQISAAVQLARDDVEKGFTRSFDGSVDAYLRLLQRETVRADADPAVGGLVDRVSDGDVSALRELAASRPAAQGPASRPTGRADSRPAAGGDATAKPPPKRLSALGAREEKRAAAASKDDESVRADIRSRIAEMSDAELGKLGDATEDEVVDAVLSEYRKVRAEKDGAAPGGGEFRTVGAVGPARSRSISEAIKRLLASRR